MPSSEIAKKSSTGTQAIERAISILRRFTDNDKPLSLTEIARAVGLPAPTTHRMLGSLVRERLIVYDPATERYQIGPDSLFLFAAAARRYGIAAARSELEPLVAATDETATLGVLDGSDTIVVLQVESDLPLRFSRPVGTRVPVHVSAMGKALLAFTAEDIPASVRSLGKLHRYTDHTVTDRHQLIGDLLATRERGWALSDHERYTGVRAVAVPILHDGQPPRASVGVQGPAERLGDERLPAIVEALQHTAGRLSLHLQVTTL